MVTVTDEAFGILLIENYFNKWNTMNPDDKAIYTSSNTGNKIFSGWSKEGIKRYYELCHKIANERKKRTCNEVEKLFRDRMMEKYLKAQQEGRSTLF